MMELLQKLNCGDMVIYLNPTEIEMLFDYFEHKNFDIEQLGQSLRNCHIGLIDELQRVAIDNYGLEKLASKIFMTRKVLENRKINRFHQLQAKSGQMLENMRNYVEGKYDLDTEVKISYRMINGDEKLFYDKLNLDDEFSLETVSFSVNLHTGLVTNYQNVNFKGKKQKENWEENLRMPGNSYSVKSKEPHHYSKANEMDSGKVLEAINKEKNRIVVELFGVERQPDDPMFNDPEFKKLYEDHTSLKQESIRSAHEMDYLLRNKNPQVLEQVREKEGKQL